MNRKMVIVFLGLLSGIGLLAGIMISCSGGGGGGGTQFSSPEKAAAASSAAMGAVQLSSTVGASADMISGSIPAGYAPGKAKSIDTSAIANIDPRLKAVVDKMVAHLKKPAVVRTMSKAALYKTMSAPLLSAGTSTGACAVSGGYSITFNSVVTGEAATTTTNTMDITFHNCTETAGFNDFSSLSGIMTGTHVFDTAGNEAADLNVNLTGKECTDASCPAGTVIATFALNGVFESINHNGSDGSSSALGTFSGSEIATNSQFSFQFGAGATPVTDAWTSLVSNGTTETHTGNGTYVLSVTRPGESLELNITLAGLEDKVKKYTTGDEEEWVNGSVSIRWSPDLSQWGCANGTYTFTTAAETPIQTSVFSNCPTSGIVKVNNATIKFAAPSGGNVTVTLDSGPSQVFTDCESLGGGGLCGS